ncbi:MAG: hypothetical protein CTY16_18845 [Methylobacter sp.]|nr:MAG: hypothetical protein CTY16_18845 [Methylobacter sp.]
MKIVSLPASDVIVLMAADVFAVIKSAPIPVTIVCAPEADMADMVTAGAPVLVMVCAPLVEVTLTAVRSPPEMVCAPAPDMAVTCARFAPEMVCAPAPVMAITCVRFAPVIV